jgi:hypothetical protein
MLVTAFGESLELVVAGEYVAMESLVVPRFVGRRAVVGRRLSVVSRRSSVVGRRSSVVESLSVCESVVSPQVVVSRRVSCQ